MVGFLTSNFGIVWAIYVGVLVIWCVVDAVRGTR